MPFGPYEGRGATGAAADSPRAPCVLPRVGDIEAPTWQETCHRSPHSAAPIFVRRDEPVVRELLQRSSRRRRQGRQTLSA